MSIFLEYVVVFICIYLFYYFLITRSYEQISDSKKKKKKVKKEISVELLYIKKIYNVDINCIDRKKFNYLCTGINSFIITTIYIILVYLLKRWIFRIIIGAFLLILMFIICYGILGRYYLKKGSR